MNESSNAQNKKFKLTTGAVAYRTRSDPTATPPYFLVEGSQNVLINEATDQEGDKVESRPGYELLGSEDETREGIKSAYVFRTKVGEDRHLRFTKDSVLQYYSDTLEDWEELFTTGLDGDYPMRFATVWDASELLRLGLFVNHNANLYSWSGAIGTLAQVDDATHVSLNENIAGRGFRTTGTRSIRIKDSGGVWRETVYTGQSGVQFTVSSDLTGFTFDADAPVVEVVRTTSNTPASGFINDIILTLENHVHIGSHASQIVYMSKSTDYTAFTFSSPRLATEGWQFVFDDFAIGFETNIAGEGRESLVVFCGRDWLYRTEFVDLSDGSSIAQIVRVKPIIVSPGQGAVSQELIAKVKNSIIYLNASNELLELGSVENITTVQQTPISDEIKADFIAADFDGGNIKFRRNNLFVTAAASGRMFILAFRDDQRGSRRFWQPPQILPVGILTDFDGNLVGHSSNLKESYNLFVGTSDNGQPIAFKAHFAYSNFGARDKLKNFDKYFVELYMRSNAIVYLKLIYEYLGAKTIKTYELNGSDTTYLFQPNLSASLGVNSLGSAPLGSLLDGIEDLIKYRRFKKVVPIDFFEFQPRFECDELDAQFQILCHGSNAIISTNAPAKITN